MSKTEPKRGLASLLGQVHTLAETTRRLSSGDFTARTGLADEPGEIGELAQAFDHMAEGLEQHLRDREQTENRSINRALQQTAVAALGQFALTSDDFTALLNQAVSLVTQTLEVEFCRVLELQRDGTSMLLRAGLGWKEGLPDVMTVSADPGSQAGYTLRSGEPVVITHLPTEQRFESDPFLEDHNVLSGVSVAIAARGETYGVMSVYSGALRNFNSDDLQFLLAVANVLAVAVEHARSQAEIRKLANFAQLNPNPAMELSPEGTITYFNNAAARLAESVGCSHPSEILPSNISSVVQSCFASGKSKPDMHTILGARTLSWSLHPMPANNVVHCYVTDITDRLDLEAQLRHAQKMESVGQLAAGVAHDFNNMLTVIQGHAGILMTRKALAPELHESVQSVSFAAERAASLTRQLLLFSRKSVMQPKLLDLREVVGNMTKMLKRLLGEIVTLEFNPPAEIPLVEGDTAMIEQVIMNLAVNARDAMALGGKLSIGILPVTFDENYVQAHSEARAGSFVCLRVSDTGHGMNSSTLSRIFEPFFTTKEMGKGTGLGLATVYGIVRQHGGWIEVASEVNKGTTFRVFFPATAQMASGEARTDLFLAQVRGGTETILIVEDEPAVLAMGRIILQECGYNVIEASSGVEALEVWQEHGDKIDMLLTDMVMPHGLSGMELGQLLTGQKPSLKVIFTSGYNVDEFETEFIHKGGALFLQKPYTRFTLATAVRESLDRVPQA